ncbi:MAG: ABC transporter ATP-binding protein [Candidatus Kariarchaeaceae archaeon]
MTDTFLYVENVTKKYGDFLALDNFSCTIPSGVTGLLGPNGAGKTTFIRSLLGIHPFQSGRIQFLDYELPRDLLQVKDLIGYQPEVDTRIIKTSAIRYVMHMCRLAGLPRQAAIQRAFDTLHYVGLEDARYRDMTEFSQGMLQKVKLATALVHDPELLLLDEPTAGCDPQSREQILNLIYDLGLNYGKNIVISTHLLPDIEKNANFVVVLNKGRTVMEGSLEAVMKQKDDSVRLQVQVSGSTQKFANILEENGFSILSVDGDISCLAPPELVKTQNYSTVFKLAKTNNVDIRLLTPFRLRLEDVFIDIVDEGEEQ